jgi:fumarate hydratase subunit beta
VTQTIRITPPMDISDVKKLKAGDNVLITGTIYTGRDAAHKRLIQLLEKGKTLPVDLKGQIIYYVGPAPAKPGYAVGSAGPTTSYRMDPYTPQLLELGLKGMIGKGARSAEVIDAMKKHGAVYLGAVGGAAALIAKAIKKAEVVCYEDLGPEAIHKFYVEDFPAIVVIDSEGNNLYETEPAKFKID